MACFAIVSTLFCILLFLSCIVPLVSMTCILRLLPELQVLLSREGVAKICDFGLSRLFTGKEIAAKQRTLHGVNGDVGGNGGTGGIGIGGNGAGNRPVGLKMYRAPRVASL